jgi:hypothetical protein
MMIFNMLTSYFHKNSFHYFEDYLMIKMIFFFFFFGLKCPKVEELTRHFKKRNAYKCEQAFHF